MPPDREKFLDFIARCEQAFRPFAPIELPEFFKGRLETIRTLQSELRTPGRQVAVFGERGVGKTSLALLAGVFAGIPNQKLFLVRCESSSTYESIFGQILAEAGHGQISEFTEREGGPVGGLHLGPIRAEVSRTTRTRERPLQSGASITAAKLLDVFRSQEALIVIDEYDRVRDESTHLRMGETLKHFSDANSKTKMMIVGVADSVRQLVGGHASLTRCLAQIRLDRMSRDELGEIVTTGEERTGAVFHPDVRRRIIGLADGFPFIVHLLCKYALDDVVASLRDRTDLKAVVGEREYISAIRRAVSMGEASLREDYECAVITVKRKTERYRDVLWAIAYSDSIEVQVNEIADNIHRLTGEKPTARSLNAYLGPLTSAEKCSVLDRVRQGYYRFSNPLMRAYIRMILEQNNIELGGQMTFPWMH